MLATKQNYPQLVAAFRAIEEDNGGHLLGTVYPGQRINLEEFEIPDAWVHLCSKAEAGLKRLHEASPKDWSTFVCGEQSEAEAIEYRQKDLFDARRVLNDFFEGWQLGDAPPNEILHYRQVSHS